MSDFSLTIAQQEAGPTVKIAGAIDESVELKLPEDYPSGIVRIDVGDVESINSLGVNVWLRFVRGLRDSGQQVVINRLSPALLFQASMISTFLLGIVVESFVVEYVCPSCDNVESVLFAGDAEVPERRTCAECKDEMELDAPAESYSAFR